VGNGFASAEEFQSKHQCLIIGKQIAPLVDTLSRSPSFPLWSNAFSDGKRERFLSFTTVRNEGSRSFRLTVTSGAGDSNRTPSEKIQRATLNAERAFYSREIVTDSTRAASFVVIFDIFIAPKKEGKKRGGIGDRDRVRVGSGQVPRVINAL